MKNFLPLLCTMGIVLLFSGCSPSSFPDVPTPTPSDTTSKTSSGAFVSAISSGNNVNNSGTPSKVKKEIPIQIPDSDMTITSSAFENGGMIPDRFTCDGANVNPPFTIFNVPAGTKTLIFIISDPQGKEGKFVHWLVWNIPPNTMSISENSVPSGAQLSQNNFGDLSYGGMCPPPGETHTYLFELYATDKVVKGLPNWSAGHFMVNTYGHLLGKAKMEAKYTKK